MILGLLLLGFLSAFALGPSSFNIIRHLVTRKSWPWMDIVGFLTADLTLIAISLVLLRSPFLQTQASRTVLTLITVGCLSAYALQILLRKNPLPLEASENSKNSFFKSFLLGTSNLHLVLIYAGLFINVTMDGDIPYQPVLFYFGSFLFSFFGLLWIIRSLKELFRPVLRQLEVTAAFGFLMFSIYLSWGIL